jgi:hypothetical protein
MIKRFLSLLMLFSIGANAQSCYSVALWSIPKKAKKPNMLISYEAECKVFEISSQVTQRCGCYDSVSEAKELLKKYINKFHTAYITPTRRSRFEIVEKKPSVKVQAKSYVAKSFELSTIEIQDNNNSLKSALKENRELSKKHIDNESDFYGLNLYGNYGQYFNQNYLDRAYTDYESKIQLKFELFKNGYFEHKKDKLFRSKQLEFNYFKNLSFIQKSKFADNTLIFEELSNKIDAYYYKELANLYESIIDKKREALKMSLITSYDFELLRQYKKRYLRLAEIYTKDETIALSKEFYELFQNIEYIKLIDIDKLISNAKRENIDINIQDAQIALFDTDESYMDRVKMNLYVNRREVDELGWYNTIGLEANLPIDFSTQEQTEFLKLEKNAKQITKNSVEKNLLSSLKKSYITFENIQNLIDLDKDDIDFFKNRVKKFEFIRKNAITNLSFDPDEKILLNQKKILELKHNVLLQRVKLYKILNKIAYISNSENIKNIIKEKI